MASMLTLTISHSRDDDLAWLLKKLAEAKKRLFGDRLMRKVFEQMRICVVTSPIPNSRTVINGWHPHHHIIVFADYDVEKFAVDTIAVLPMVDEFGGLYYSYVDNKKEQVLIKRNKIIWLNR